MQSSNPQILKSSKNSVKTFTKFSNVFLLFFAVLSTEAHAIKYDVNRSKPCTSTCTGNITLTGWLEVASVGSVNPSTGITNWSLTFNSTNGTNTLTPANSTIVTSGSPTINATASQLQIVLPTPANPSTVIWGISDSSAFPVTISWQFQGGSSMNAQEILTNATNIMTFADQAVVNPASEGNGGTVILPVQPVIIPFNAPIDFSFNHKPVETTPTEIELK